MKKFSILALVAVLIATLFAGCRDTMDQNDGKPTTNESSNATQSTKPSTQATNPSTQATTPSTQATTPSTQGTMPGGGNNESSNPSTPSDGARLLPRL